MSTLTFDWKEDDEETGVEGWFARGYDHFDASKTEDFGHDCIEHMPRGMKHGRIADELLALGARLHYRVESGWWFSQRGFGKPAKAFATEVEYLLEDMEYNHVDLKETKPLVLEPGDCSMDMEAMVQEIVAEIIDSMKEVDMEEGDFFNEQTVHQMGYWLRRGIIAGRARFKGRHPADVMHLMDNLHETLRDYKHGELGESLVVRIHEKDMEYSVRAIRNPWNQ